MVSIMHSEKTPYSSIQLQPQYSKNELGGLSLNDYFLSMHKPIEMIPITAKDLTEDKPQEFVYKIWKETFKVTVTLTDPKDSSGTIQWNNGTIYSGPICKMRVVAKETDDFFETIVPYCVNNSKCQITYKDKSYIGTLENHLAETSRIITFIGKGTIAVLNGEERYTGEMGFDLSSGDIFPNGKGVTFRMSSIFEGTQFYLLDYQGNEKGLQHYGKGKLTNTKTSNRYEGDVVITNSGFSPISLPNNNKFEKGTFFVNPFDCQDLSRRQHYEKVATGQLVTKTYCDQKYLFGEEANTLIYDKENGKLINETNENFLVLQESLSVLFPTELLHLKLEKGDYYGTFTLLNFEPIGTGILTFNSDIYNGKVVFSPDGIPSIFPKSPDHEILVGTETKKVKIGFGALTTKAENSIRHFYFDKDGNFYPVPDEVLKTLTSYTSFTVSKCPLERRLEIARSLKGMAQPLPPSVKPYYKPNLGVNFYSPIKKYDERKSDSRSSSPIKQTIDTNAASELD